MSGCLCGIDLSRVLSSLQTLIDQADRVATSAPSESMRAQGAAEMVGLVKARYLLELEQLRAKRSRGLGGGLINDNTCSYARKCYNQIHQDNKQTGSGKMKNLYEIKNHKGIHLCYQVAKNEKDAVETARIYYGYKSAKVAVFIRED